MSFFKKSLNLLAIPLVATFLSLVVVKPVNAAEFHFTDYTQPQDQTTNDDVYITTSTANVNGVIQGDLVIIAQNAQVSGTITGDTYIIGANTTFTGNVYGNLFILANNAAIRGIVKGNIYSMASGTTFNGQVEKDFLSISGETSVSGAVGDDVRVISNNANIDSVTKGDVIVLANSENVSKEKVSGNVYDHVTLKGIAQEQGVNIDHEDTKILSNWDWTDKIFMALFSFVSMGLVGYFMIMMTPVKTGKIIAKITGSSKDFMISFLIGLLVLVLAPLALIMLSLSVVGLPLALFVAGLLLFLTIFGKLWVEVAFGQEILELLKLKGYRPFKSLAIGRVLTVILNLIPVLGPLYTFVLMATATGAFIRMKKDYWDKGSKK